MKEYVIDVIEITEDGEEVHHKKQIRVESDKKAIKEILGDAITNGEIEPNSYNC